MSGARAQIGDFVANLKRDIQAAAAPDAMRALGEKAIELIVRRTRLGYGVENAGDERQPLMPLSERYKRYRQLAFAGRVSGVTVSDMTSAGRSNLTLTGQMLDSMAVTKVSSKSATIGPIGYRTDGKANQQIANYVTKAGRPFNNLTRLEREQLIRFYRNKFGDLLKNARITF